MKLFLYTLKVWLTTVISALPAVIYTALMEYWFSPGDVSASMAIILLNTLPFAIGFWLIARFQYKRNSPVLRKKLWLGCWGIISIFFFGMNFISPRTFEWWGFLLLWLGFIISLIVYKLPYRKPIAVTDYLKGRHVLLRVQENNLQLHGIIVSELNIWPIKVKLHDNQPNSLLELRSLQPDELFTSLNYQTAVKVKAFTADRGEFLFNAVLELDHTLN
ncbi:hypothetical protein ACFOTA_06350 [Chitinophaga sp. GCM10012297]|uniref:MFS transporter n=1 Tax=Chitinophaga chungangae TaxID=2821488 RepID=A0ABS3YAW4_9BACT|nr:hypothetical protein [Chitinophaga chungangae]MBO9151820.1 hypothetical protein [Chitinophaga chungangae]